MDEEKIGLDPEQEENGSDGAVEKTQKAVRLIGRIIVGALAAALAAEAWTFKKKK